MLETENEMRPQYSVPNAHAHRRNRGSTVQEFSSPPRLPRAGWGLTESDGITDELDTME